MEEDLEARATFFLLNRTRFMYKNFAKQKRLMKIVSMVYLSLILKYIIITYMIYWKRCRLIP